jgi:hypothetical protein
MTTTNMFETDIRLQGWSASFFLTVFSTGSFLICSSFTALNGPWGLQHLYLKVPVEERKERRKMCRRRRGKKLQKRTVFKAGDFLTFSQKKRSASGRIT